LVNWLYVVVGVNSLFNIISFWYMHTHPELNKDFSDLKERLARLEAKVSFLVKDNKKERA